MEVDGDSFRRAREEIKKNPNLSKNKELRLRGEPLEGTQEWLAREAKIRNASGELVSLSVRTIQYLEKGNASLQVIDAVSAHLNINGRELIKDYGNSSVKLSAPIGIDFRPTVYPIENLNNFHESPLLFSIDPLWIEFNSDDLYQVRVNNISATLLIDDFRIEFKWIYFVSLTPDGKGWLGIEREAYPFEMNSPQRWMQPLMFTQFCRDMISWEAFIKLIKGLERKMIKIEVEIDFVTFKKKLKIAVARAELINLLCFNKLKYPFYLQPDALQWDDNCSKIT